MAGIFDTIGQTDPSKELGLPPDSIRDDMRSSAETARGPASRKPPTDLGRVSPIPPLRDSPSPTRGKHIAKGEVKSIPNRASSLLGTSPANPPSIEAASGSTHRPVADQTLLSPASLSRVSSSSSSRRPAPVADLNSPPTRPKLTDFDPPMDEADDTLRPRRSSDLSVLSPTSVRLVRSPRPDSPGSKEHTGFKSDTPWGKAGSALQSDQTDRAPSPLVPAAPEDDEEKGRRLACE